MQFIKAFFSVRFFRKMSPFPLLDLCNLLQPYANLHGIRFEEHEMVLPENNPFAWLEGITNGPKNRISYVDVIDMFVEADYVFVLLRTGYYHRFSRWDNERIYNHIYYDRTKGENWFIRWWYKL